MSNCVMCGSPLPDNQGSNTCSMCYGDPGHGTDGYYQDWLERSQEEDIQHQIDDARDQDRREP